MQTSDPDIYAVGDCVECTSLITGRQVRAPYGDIANLQGRVAGQNI
jgi:NADPH-dependent 2,4-dienoyl-CoA reductase/sulfur reductase-like enzyme